MSSSQNLIRTFDDLPDNDRACILRIAPVYAEDLRSPRKEAVVRAVQATCPIDTQLCRCRIVHLVPSCLYSRTSDISGAKRLRCTARRYTAVC